MLKSPSSTKLSKRRLASSARLRSAAATASISLTRSGSFGSSLPYRMCTVASVQFEAGDDLGDVVDGLIQARAVGRRIELADVPGCEQQGGLEVLVRDFGVQLCPQRGQP